MTDPATLAVIAATFLLAGTVKGVIGLGLPTITLAALTVMLDLKAAMALLLVPSFVTNLWQGANGGHAMAIARRLWPFLAMATATVWLGAMALTRIDTHLLSGLLGLLIAAYAVTGFAGMRLKLPIRHEVWAGPVLGMANGVLTGMTGSFVVPGVMFLQAIGLPRDQLIQAMGVLFTLSTLALGLALQGNGLLSPELGALSAAGVVPAILGMMLGAAIRRQLPEALFRRVFFAALLVLGGYIAATAARG